MLFESYNELLKVMLYIATMLIAISLVYLVITEGGVPLIAAQTDGYESVIMNSTNSVINIVNGSGVF